MVVREILAQGLSNPARNTPPRRVSSPAFEHTAGCSAGREGWRRMVAGEIPARVLSTPRKQRRHPTKARPVIRSVPQSRPVRGGVEKRGSALAERAGPLATNTWTGGQTPCPRRS